MGSGLLCGILEGHRVDSAAHERSSICSSRTIRLVKHTDRSNEQVGSCSAWVESVSLGVAKPRYRWLQVQA